MDDGEHGHDGYVDYQPPQHPNCKRVFVPPEDLEASPISADLLDRNAIRKQTRARGVTLDDVPDDRLDGLLLTCRGNVDIAVDALVLDPRPAWVTLHVGKREPVKPTNMTR